MKRSLIQVFLVALIFFFISVSSVCLHYSSLAGVNLFPTDLSFENGDQEELAIRQEEEATVFVSNVSPNMFLLKTGYIEQILPFSFLSSSLDQKTFVLRC